MGKLKDVKTRGEASEKQAATVGDQYKNDAVDVTLCFWWLQIDSNTAKLYIFAWF